jgi:hypothetical protein
MDIMRAFTVTVAKRESPAHYYINSVQVSFLSIVSPVLLSLS